MDDVIRPAECAAVRLLMRAGYRSDAIGFCLGYHRTAITNHARGDCAHDLDIGAWDGSESGDPERADAAVRS